MVQAWNQQVSTGLSTGPLTGSQDPSPVLRKRAQGPLKPRVFCPVAPRGATLHYR